MERQRPDLVLFLDECLGTTVVPGILRSRGIDVRLLQDHFKRGTRDSDWLLEVGKRGWIVLTKDKRIRRRTVELRALTDAGVYAFVLTAGDLSGAEMGEAFAKAYSRMQEIVMDKPAPLIATIDSRGQVRVLHSP